MRFFCTVFALLDAKIERSALHEIHCNVAPKEGVLTEPVPNEGRRPKSRLRVRDGQLTKHHHSTHHDMGKGTSTLTLTDNVLGIRHLLVPETRSISIWIPDYLQAPTYESTR